MDANVAIAQAMGLRRVAADLDRDGAQMTRNPDDEKFPGEKFIGCLLAAPVLRALAAELALKAIAIKTTGAHKRGHDLLKLFDALDQKTQAAVEKHKGVIERFVHGSVRSILDKHRDDFTDSRYIGESWQPGANPPTYAYGGDLDVALQALIATFNELPNGAARSAP